MGDKPVAGPIALFQRYLARRRPHLLAADAFILLLMYVLSTHLWVAVDATELSGKAFAGDGFLSRTLQIRMILQSIAAFFWYGAIFLLAWAAARLLAESWRTGPGGSQES